MKRNIMIGGGLILLVIAGGGYLATKVTKDALTVEDNSQNLNTSAENATIETLEDETTSGKGSLLGLMALGRSQECTFVVRTDGMVQEGTAFYDGDNARVDTLIKRAATEDIASYMIMDKRSNTMYLWGSTQGDQGIKMTISSAGDTTPAPMNNPQTPTNAPTVTPDMDVDYTCKPWRVDGSVFVPPATIEFMDMSEMQKMMEGIDGISVPRP
ncbi:MAG: hypothetical protein RLZZ360_574 [Candidatus Parcubacteria bacterium]|jgi:hypothetical protein